MKDKRDTQNQIRDIQFKMDRISKEIKARQSVMDDLSKELRTLYTILDENI